MTDLEDRIHKVTIILEEERARKSEVRQSSMRSSACVWLWSVCDFVEIDDDYDCVSVSDKGGDIDQDESSDSDSGSSSNNNNNSDSDIHYDCHDKNWDEFHLLSLNFSYFHLISFSFY